MRVMIVTDAWEPQVNGVVRTLKQTRAELEAMNHEVQMITPLEFTTIPCPTYPDISLSLLPGQKVRERLNAFMPDAIHIATEGPLGLAARSYAIKNNLPFSSAYHTRFPEYVQARTNIPLSWTYQFLRWFHRPSQAVLAPTLGIKQDLEKWGFTKVVLWSRGVDLDIFTMPESKVLNSAHPIYLYVGRVAVEKNIQAFLELDLTGSKWVVGDGPALADIRQKYPNVNYFGVLNQAQLAQIYAVADVFVFPSKTDTFGLVMLEAMACGLPVAAYPVTGPIDVLGQSKAGVMSENLQEACLEALKIPKEAARAHAELFSWRVASEQFLNHLKPIRKSTSDTTLARKHSFLE